jgi:hypothetical protein
VCWFLCFCRDVIIIIIVVVGFVSFCCDEIKSRDQTKEEEKPKVTRSNSRIHIRHFTSGISHQAFHIRHFTSGISHQASAKTKKGKKAIY